jgi:5'-3' exonuclease
MIYIVDCQYLLRRNYSAMTHSGSIISSEALLRSVKASIRKISTNKTDQIFLLFDKQPYFKSKYLPEYKCDREYANDEGLQRLIDSKADEFVIMKYRIDIHNNKEFTNAKYKLIEQDNRSILIKGYEADDIARFMSEYYTNNNIDAILYTIDSDWLYFCSDHVKMITPKGISKEDEYKKLQSRYVDFDIPLNKIGMLHELYFQGHNNVPNYSDKSISFKLFCNSIYNNINNIPDQELFKKYYDGMSLIDHNLNVEEIINNVSKRISYRT